MEIECDVAVVGGGVAGASLACALAGSDLSVVVLERTLGGEGLNRGDALAPGVMPLLDSWGVKERLEERGPIHREFYHWYTVEDGLCMRLDLRVHPKYSYGLTLDHRIIETELLRKAAEASNVRVLLRHNVRGLLRNDGWIAGVEGKSSDGTFRVKAAAVISVEGQKGKLPEDVGIKSEYYENEHEYLMLDTLSVDTYRGQALMTFSRYGIVGYFELPNGRARMPIQLPAGGGAELKNTDFAWVKQNLHRMIRDVDPNQLDFEGSHVYKIHEHHVPAYGKDGLLLLGDVAHTVHPVAGQGMNMALRDAAALAGILKRHGVSRERFGAILNEYDGQRRPINEQIWRRCRKLAQWFTTTGYLAHLSRRLYLRTVPRLPGYRAKIQRMVSSFDKLPPQ